MWQVLNPGGILILTTIPTDRQWHEKPRFMLASNTPDFSGLFAIDYGEDAAYFNILDVFHNQDTSELKVWGAELHLILRDEQEKLLKKAGFRMVEFYGDFDFLP